MRKIKVLHIITRLISGGAENNTLLTVKGLREKGYEVGLAAGPSDQKEGDLEYAFHQLDIKLFVLPSFVRQPNLIKDLITAYKLYVLIRKEKYDIVHTHVSKAGILGRWAAKLAGVPIICHTTHGNIFDSYFNKYLTKMFILFNKITVKITDKMITITNVGKKQWLDYHIGRSCQYVSIYSGIDMNVFTSDAVKKSRSVLRKSVGLSDNDIIIGNVGRLAPIKGHRYLIEAIPLIVHKVKNAKFLIIGDGPSREELEALSNNLKVDGYINFIGMNDNIPELLSIMDIFVLPSLNEGMGRALVEAMAMRLPCVASAVGGVVEVIAHEETGLLVLSKDPNALADSIIRLIENQSEAEAIAGRAQKKACSIFSSQTMINDIVKVYEDLIPQ